MNAMRKTWWGAALAAVLALALAGAADAGSRDQEKGKAKAKAEAEEHGLMFAGGSNWLGVRISDVTPETVRAQKLPGEYGVVVEDVEEDSPAAKAGVQKEDVILSFADERVRGVAHLQRLLRETPAGRQVAVQVSRGGKTQTLAVTPEARRARMWMPEFSMPQIEITPMPEIAPEFNFQLFSPGGYRLGVSAEELTGQLAEYFGVKGGQGVLVKEVVEGSPAAKAGLKAGDVIVRVDQVEINNVNDLRRALREEREKNEVTLTFVRERREQSVKVELEAPQRPGRRRIALAPHPPMAPRAPMAPRGPMAVQPPQPPAPKWDEEMEMDENSLDPQELEELRDQQQELQDRYQEELERYQEEMQGEQEKLQEKFQSDEFRQHMEELKKEMREHEQELRLHQEELKRQLEKARKEGSWV